MHSLFLLTAAIFSLTAHAEQISVDLPTRIFLQNLKEGDTSVEVRELQRVLNNDPDTMIAGLGAGSPGRESEFFGPATTDAVIRFQNKYASEVLSPAGLQSGSGFVGLWTRLKLNQLLLNPAPAKISPTNTSVTNTTTVPSMTGAMGAMFPVATFSSTDKLSLSFPSKNYGAAGDKITLGGTGFSSRSNTVHFGKSADVRSLSTKNPNELTFTVPEKVKPGRYDISVNKATDTIPFMVTTPGAPLPVVERIEPAEAKFGQKIKITGQNFKATDNIITSHLGVVDGVSSPDGKTLEFTIPLPEYLSNENSQLRKVWFGQKDNLYWPVHVRVVNENGISDDSAAAKFIINI